MFGFLDIVRLLLEAGAPVNIPDSIGCTSLHYAVLGGDFRIVELLIQFKGDVDITDKVISSSFFIFLYMNESYFCQDFYLDG